MSCLQSRRAARSGLTAHPDRVELSRQLAQLYCSSMSYRTDRHQYIGASDGGAWYLLATEGHEGENKLVSKPPPARPASPASPPGEVVTCSSGGGGSCRIVSPRGPGDMRPRIRIMRWSTGGTTLGQSVAQVWAAMCERRPARQACWENPRDLRRQEGWDAAVAVESGCSSAARAPLRDWVCQKRISGTSDSKVKPRQEICSD